MKRRKPNTQRHAPTGARGSPLQFSEDEVLVLLAAGLQTLANPGNLAMFDDEDKTSVRQLRDACVKLAEMVGMDKDTLAQFAAYAAGKPPEGIVAILEREVRDRS